MDRNEKINELLDVLQFMREKPRMFFSGVEAGNNFLRGFNIAAGLCLDLPSDDDIRGKVTTEKGWTWSSLPPWSEMKEQGLDDTAIIDEMLSIEIEVWKRLLANLDSQASEKPE